ncbi:protein of unknown function DUF81 [Thermocrinis albus DSM 14484]|uniref:Probable membrane transporter protein n=1 Tax=Thermocrinis albus (strain DSM 14484 / JCM 11386 / HI 11/12) TaxID=638303 RepID=D3SLF3_THEAH|nr:TSUP family transporter [Thermocrinis albus]ADC89583.1 protein of unknown function DUF81 [Thermocrinis albus DSM 14484]
MEEGLSFLVVLGASFLAGVTNAVAGGGTLLTFPALMLVGVDPVSANVTNTVALWTGPMAGAWAFRRRLPETKQLIPSMVLISATGSIVGALLLLYTPSSIFKKLVPFLILFATLLLVLSGRFHLSERNKPVALLIQFLAAVYGAYFGAGLGIMVLATLSLLGVKDIHAANSLKNMLGFLINGIAAILFVLSGKVVWTFVLIMMLGFALGGYTGGMFSQRFRQDIVRRAVVIWGLFLSLFYFLDNFKGI